MSAIPATVQGAGPWIQAAFTDDVAYLSRLLRIGVDVNSDSYNGQQLGYTALHVASWNGSTSCVSVLMQGGAAVNIQAYGNPQTGRRSLWVGP
ncbi:hypothetical protein Pelo_4867 [Pelomyxa schiedti]|nr:hypothetical protein Pelo_4867 [Pelomyxa schiedti]